MLKDFPWNWEASDDMLMLEGKYNGHDPTIMWAERCPSCHKKDHERFPCGWPDKEHADFILKACNNYQEMLGHLRIYYNTVGGKKPHLSSLFEKLGEKPYE